MTDSESDELHVKSSPNGASHVGAAVREPSLDHSAEASHKSSVERQGAVDTLTSLQEIDGDESASLNRDPALGDSESGASLL